MRSTFFQWVILCICALLFFIGTVMYVGHDVRFHTWPDEMSNTVFIIHFVETGSFRISHDAVSLSSAVFPRSVTQNAGALVPGTFLGFVLWYGLIATAFGLWILPYLTPLAGAALPLLWYGIARKFFTSTVSFCAALTLYFCVPLVYYSQLVLLPNIFFVCMLSAMILCLLHKHPLCAYLAGFLGMIALSIRPQDFFFILILVLGFLLVVRDKSVARYGLMGLGVLVAAIPFVGGTYATFGTLFGSGYVHGGAVLPQAAEGNILLPFGFKPKTILDKILTFIVEPFWYLCIPALVGGITAIVHRFQQRMIFVFVMSLASLYTLAYYGSWVFEDVLTNTLNFMGLSYVRYWLIVYIFLSILAVYGFSVVLKKISFRSAVPLVLVWSILSFVSVYALLNTGHDKLSDIRSTRRQYADIHAAILPVLPPDAVVFTERGDKIIFPDRQVITQWQWNDMRSYDTLYTQGIPLYYFTHKSFEDVSVDISVSPFVKLTEVSRTENYTLYMLTFDIYGKNTF